MPRAKPGMPPNHAPTTYVVGVGRVGLRPPRGACGDGGRPNGVACPDGDVGSAISYRTWMRGYALCAAMNPGLRSAAHPRPSSQTRYTRSARRWLSAGGTMAGGMKNDASPNAAITRAKGTHDRQYGSRLRLTAKTTQEARKAR